MIRVAALYRLPHREQSAADLISRCDIPLDAIARSCQTPASRQGNGWPEFAIVERNARRKRPTEGRFTMKFTAGTLVLTLAAVGFTGCGASSPSGTPPKTAIAADSASPDMAVRTFLEA